MEKIFLKILGNQADFEEYKLSDLLDSMIRRYGFDPNGGISSYLSIFPVKLLQYEGAIYKENLIEYAKTNSIPYQIDPDHRIWLAFQGEEWRKAVTELKAQMPDVQFPPLNQPNDRFVLKYEGKFLDLSSGPKLMGIVNVTPDSFSDGGQFLDPERAVQHILELIEDGADIIDIGAESTRPGSPRISADEEWQRLKPVLELIEKEKIDKKIWISLDTYKSIVAEKALNYGIHIINDISSGEMDSSMMDVVAEAGCPYIMMHMKGTPESMQKNPQYEHLMDEIIAFFERKIGQAEEKGIKQIIIDPGIGFGKRIEDNYEIVRRLEEFSNLGYPVLLGASRKSFLWKKLKIEPKQADDSTMIVDLLGIQNKAHILRVHNVKKHKEMVTVLSWINQLKAT